MIFARFALVVLIITIWGCARSPAPEVTHLPRETSPESPPEVADSSTPTSAAEQNNVVPEEEPSMASESSDKASSVKTLLEEEPLLLLDDEEAANGKAHDSMADNSRCFVCHLNYEMEEIAQIHAREGYGCAYCHGQSDAHIADESWASGGNGTPPDVMYRPHEVIPACLKCHELSKSDPECRCEFPHLEEKKLCTDCHGSHRLKSRKCHWK